MNDSDYSEWLGFTLIGVPPLQGPAHVPLGRGLTAIYGKNGAGKTRLLRALAGEDLVSSGAASMVLHLVLDDGLVESVGLGDDKDATADPKRSPRWCLSFGDRMRESMAAVAVMGGTKRASSAAQAEILLRFTRVKFIVVVDRARHEVLSPAWADALKLLADGQSDDAVARWASVRTTSPEEQTLHTIGSIALRDGFADRLSFFGLREADILYYLHPNEFREGWTNWDAVKAEMRNAGQTDLKSWIKMKGGKGKLNPASLRRAAESLRALPEEFIALGEHVAAVTGSHLPR